MSSRHATSKSSCVQSSTEPVSIHTSSPSSPFHTLSEAHAAADLKPAKRRRSVNDDANERNESCAPLMFFDESMMKALLSSLQASVLQSDNTSNELHWSVFQKAAVAVRKAAPENMKYLCTPLRMKMEYQRLWREYQVFQAYKSQNSFSIDQRGVISGDSKAIDAFMKAHPEAVMFRDTPLAFKEELDELFDAIYARALSTCNRRRAESEAFDSIETDGDVSSANKSILTSSLRRRGVPVKKEQLNNVASSYVETESETDESEYSKSSTTEPIANITLEAVVITATRIAEAILARKIGYQGSSVGRATEVLSSGRFDLSEEDCHLAAISLTDTANAEIFLGVRPEHQHAMLQRFIVDEKAKRRRVS
ncbi:hypothetical protein KC332_g1323 [Hortaea werneckii]|nr:hypothetical protein KC358_g668 [Hortaea werneckii]KAI6852648.1 hypothetical protein KC350_g704 [Hortaea werneckii]KAI6943791.1 hypothetical protein KC341_g1269 [Hortaea werneckii]KAI6950420.1 hypothetical protein KC348_g699 [Hortaea werneckii]KAI6982588.1 hypothetical protein KC321_g560 [Hortaea werneckii]